MMKYLTKNVFVDTNIFEANNFFHTTNIHSLFNYSKIGIINLYMTKISYWEIISRVRKNLISINNEHNSYVNSLHRSFRILKNLSRYEKIEKLNLNIEGSVKELTNKLDTLIEISKIKFIEPEGVDINSVFNLYYKELPPFSNKKFEFPDAFIIKTLETWCEKNSTKMFFITKDKDFNGYRSKRIILRNDLNVFLDDVSSYYDSLQKTHLIPEIDRRIITYNSDLLIRIDEDLNSLIYLDFEKVSNYKRSKPEFVSYKVISINPTYAEVIYNFCVEISFVVHPKDTDFKKGFFPDSLKPYKYEEKLIIPCDIEIHFDRPANIKFKWINSNEAIILKLRD
ncbi:MAG: PIN domain-containing protein [Bacteroidales bacterium]